MNLLLTRPEAGPDEDPLHAALLDAGHGVLSAPLLRVEPTGARPSFEGAAGLVVTSRNALKAVAATPPISDAVRALPLFAVGPGTGALARELGFERITEGPGTGRELAEIIRGAMPPGAAPLVHLAGETLAFDLKGALAPDGITVRVDTVYRTLPAEALPAEAAAALRAGTLDGVLLMSPRTAMVYARLIQASGLVPEAARPVHFCISDAVARQLAPLGTVRVAVARAPNSQEMLALVAREAPDSF